MGLSVESVIGDLASQEAERRTSDNEHFSLGPLLCPDGIACGHGCHHSCWRSIWCRPVIAYGDEWSSTEPVALESTA